MRPLSKHTTSVILYFVAVAICSCTQPQTMASPPIPPKTVELEPKVIPSQTMKFEPGMKALAENLADQLERSSAGATINKVAVNPVTKHAELRKIVIDPFFDADSGYPVKINPRINSILSLEIARRFVVTGGMVPENLEISEFVLTGMVSLGEAAQGGGRAYKVYAAVFDKPSGIVQASAVVYIDSFDTTPMQIYQDSPVFLKGQNFDAHVSSVKKKQKEAVVKGYQDKLPASSLRVKADLLYEQKEYLDSLDYYRKAAGNEKTLQDLEILNGIFTNMVRQGRFKDAEPVYGQLLRVSINETKGVASKITFGPNSKSPVAGMAGVYGIYVRQIAKLVGSLPNCRVKIIGHSSRTGSEAYNGKLSLQRALSIQKQICTFAPSASGRCEAVGRGFQDNIIGSGADDSSDEIDRRVEFKFTTCGQ
jgi:outer membrane protein OmpA-like peptidoglycan-associated protein